MVESWKRAKRVLVNTIPVISLIVFLSSGGYDLYFEHRFENYPLQPDKRSARVVPYKWKSVTIYLTSEEVNTIQNIKVIEITSLLVGGLVLIVKGRSGRKKNGK